MEMPNRTDHNTDADAGVEIVSQHYSHICNKDSDDNTHAFAHASMACGNQYNMTEFKDD
jgi:hypothetical protein